ncbi:MAG TPA: hypothetical protein VMG10_20755 [Gemmataceae bacterium]|nr:hypothetical protein [Gemmataceae bacterium]
MPHSAKLGWSVRGVLAPLLVSVVLHGLLFLALWFWPTRTPSSPLSIQSTRIMLDTCVIEPPSPMLLPGEELPLDLRGLNVQTSLAPTILNTPPLHSRSGNTLVPPQAKTGGTPVPPGSEGGSSGGSLFPLPATASSVVFILDRSVSMGEYRKLDFARRELIASLRRLPPTVRFQVIDYNDYAESLLLDGRRGLLPAEPAIIHRAVSLLQALEAGGNTNHLAALRLGLDLHPDVLYFLTDAGDLRPEEVAVVTSRNQGSAIHSIELTRRRAPQPDGMLARLAHENHGTYRCVSLGD